MKIWLKKNCTILRLRVGLEVLSVTPDSLFLCPVHYKASSYYVNQHASKNSNLQLVLLIITLRKATRGGLGFLEQSISVFMLHPISVFLLA